MARSIDWELRPGAVIGAAWAVLIVPLHWFFAMFLAAAFHEACHLAVLKFQKRRIYTIVISLSGAIIETESLEPGEELACALAGPAGSLLLVSAAPIFPELAICGLIQGVWNLLPLYPMDGGRALICILGLICPEKAVSIAHILRWIIGMLLAVSGCFAARSFPALWFVLFFAVLRLLARKIPCNKRALAVQ